MILSTAVGKVFEIYDIPNSSISIMYTMFVMLVANITDGYEMGIISAFSAALLFNFFFVEPINSFVSSESSYIVTFIMLNIASITTSTLSKNSKKRIEYAKIREAQTKELYALMNKMQEERLKNNLLRSISHDIRTPLAVILGNSEMITKLVSEDSQCHRLAEDIIKDATWLGNLAENVLNITKAQDEGLKISKENEVAEEIIGFAVNEVQRKFPKRNYVVKVPDEILFVPMDAKLIAQVLINLINNAIRNTDDGGIIKIDLRLETLEGREYALFSVEDNGTGIKEEDIEKIFDVFFTDNEKADSQRGVGLGLSICESIVKAHGGNIYARNSEKGKGAEFIFRLPMNE